MKSPPKLKKSFKGDLNGMGVGVVKTQDQKKITSFN
jgi:hypothetical protein